MTGNAERFAEHGEGQNDTRHDLQAGRAARFEKTYDFITMRKETRTGSFLEAWKGNNDAKTTAGVHVNKYDI